MNYLPTCTSRLVVQHPCQVSFKSMQGCRRSWEDKLKGVKILSVKDHNSAKICRTWIISPHALLDLWYNICTKFHSNPCKDVGGVEKTNFDVTEGRNDGRKDGMTDKANTKCPLAILWRGHKKKTHLTSPRGRGGKWIGSLASEDYLWDQPWIAEQGVSSFHYFFHIFNRFSSLFLTAAAIVMKASSTFVESFALVSIQSIPFWSANSYKVNQSCKLGPWWCTDCAWYQHRIEPILHVTAANKTKNILLSES